MVQANIGVMSLYGVVQIARVNPYVSNLYSVAPEAKGPHWLATLLFSLLSMSPLMFFQYELVVRKSVETFMF